MGDYLRPKAGRSDLSEDLVAENGKLRIALRALLKVIRPTDEQQRRLVAEAWEALDEKPET
jgi:hypothetical protein